MIAIPGEEAPTDPGERASAMHELETQAAKSKTRGPFMIAAAVVGLLIGSGGAWLALGRNEPAAVATNGVEDEMIIVPLSAHRDLVLAPRNDAKDGSAARARPQGSTHDASSSERAIASAGPLPEPEAEPDVAEGSVMPRPGGGSPDNPFGALGPNVRQSNIGAVELTDPAEINVMVKRVMSRGGGQLKQCYEARLKSDEKLKGAWNVQFQVSPAGRATDIAVVAVDRPDAELEACIARNIESWSFVRIHEPLVVQKVYRFEGG
jgi:hypothetical protein